MRDDSPIRPMTDLETAKAKLALVRALGGEPSDDPRAVLVIGQIAAGKTTLQKGILRALGPEFASYDCNDTITYHPDLAAKRRDDVGALYELYGATEFLHRKALDHIAEHRLNVVTGYPMQRLQYATQWWNTFGDDERDHHISLVVLAVHESDSLLASIDRYLYGGPEDLGHGVRTKDGGHDLSFRVVPSIVHSLEANGAVDSLYVVDRDHTLLYQNHHGPDRAMLESPGAVAALEAGRDRPKTEAQIADFTMKLDRCRATAPAWARPTLDEAERLHRAHLRRTDVRHSSGLVLPAGPTITEALRELGPGQRRRPRTARRTVEGLAPRFANRTAR